MNDRHKFLEAERSLQAAILEQKRVEGLFTPTAVVLTITEQHCRCGAVHSVHSQQMLRAVNRRGAQWTRIVPIGLIPPHLPREVYRRAVGIDGCVLCIEETDPRQIALFDPAGEYPLWTADGKPLEQEEEWERIKRKLYTRAPKPERSPKPAKEPKRAPTTISFEDL